MPFPKKKFVDFKNHNKLNIDLNERTIIKFNGELVEKVTLVRLPFLMAKVFNSRIEIILNEKKLEKEFRIFRREEFENDRGILYFQGQMKIICKIRFGSGGN